MILIPHFFSISLTWLRQLSVKQWLLSVDPYYRNKAHTFSRSYFTGTYLAHITLTQFHMSEFSYIHMIFGPVANFHDNSTTSDSTLNDPLAQNNKIIIHRSRLNCLGLLHSILFFGVCVLYFHQAKFIHISLQKSVDIIRVSLYLQNRYLKPWRQISKFVKIFDTT